MARVPERDSPRPVGSGVFFVGCGVFLIVGAGYELVQADYAQAARRFGVGIVGILFGFLARDL